MTEEKENLKLSGTYDQEKANLYYVTILDYLKSENKNNDQQQEILNQIFPEEKIYATSIQDIKQNIKNILGGAASAEIEEEYKKRQQELKKEQQEESKIRNLSMYEYDGKLYEQVIGLKFVYQNGSNFSYCLLIKDGELTIRPCEGEELQPGQETVILSSEPLEYGSMLELVEEIRQFIHTWLDISPEFEVFASWYILLTWVYDRVPTINYLSAMGDTGTGKSRFLAVIGRITYKPIIGSGAVSVAALKRIINKWR